MCHGLFHHSSKNSQFGYLIFTLDLLVLFRALAEKTNINYITRLVILTWQVSRIVPV